MTRRTTRTAYALVLAALCSGISTATTKFALGPLTAADLLVVELTVATLAVWSLPGVQRCARSGFSRSYFLLGALEPGLAYGLFNVGLERTSAAIRRRSVGAAPSRVVVAGLGAGRLGSEA
jgi:hypothetical protein